MNVEAFRRIGSCIRKKRSKCGQTFGARCRGVKHEADWSSATRWATVSFEDGKRARRQQGVAAGKCASDGARQWARLIVRWSRRHWGQWKRDEHRPNVQ